MDVMKDEMEMKPGESIVDFLPRWYRHQIQLVDNHIEEAKKEFSHMEEFPIFLEIIENSKSELQRNLDYFSSDQFIEDIRSMQDESDTL